MGDDTGRIVVDLTDAATNEGNVVGATLRPGRPITVGRRKSDRWMARLIILSLGAFLAFTLYVAYQVAQMAALVAGCRP